MSANLLSYVRKLFSFSVEGYAREEAPVRKAKVLVSFFYYFLAAQSLSFLGSTDSFLPQQKNFTPQWSLAWADGMGFENAALVIRLFFLGAAVSGALWYPYRAVRVLVFLAVFQVHGLLSSFAQADHHWYPSLYIAFFFAFLPNIWSREAHSLEIKKKFLFAFLAAQSAILLIYTMSGLGKIIGAIEQFRYGEMHAFAKDAFALHLASWLSNTNGTSAWGPFIIDHAWLGWPLFIGVLYVQFFSFWVIIRPSLHRLWALFLFLIHAGTQLTMNILFIGSAMFLFLLFFDSPFKKAETTWRDTAGDLPIFGPLLAFLISPKKR